MKAGWYVGRFLFLSVVLSLVLPVPPARAWGPEGHSIIAEVAQRKINAPTRAAIARIFREGGLAHATLASVASWADDVKYTTRKDTRPWHYVDIPLAQNKYTPADCTSHGKKDDCIVAALQRLRADLACAHDGGSARARQARLDDLRFIVHLVGDAMQPLHTVKDLRGGNGVRVTADFCGAKYEEGCSKPHAHRQHVKFHVLWDSTLINETVWAWGSYVARLTDPKTGWLNSTEARAPDPAGTSVVAWVDDTHRQAQRVWTGMLPADRRLGQAYYDRALPILDRQLGIAGLRLARFLDAIFARHACQTH